jgi:bile acid:Na+ symporter, BASS family
MTQIKSLLDSYGKVLGLLLMMVLGILFPQLSSLSCLIQYLLMAMLFFAFLDIEIRPRSFQRGVIWVLLANILVAFVAYWILRPFSLDLALTAFMTGIAPTATAAPVIIGFLQGQVEYVVGAVLVSNISMSLILPLVLPFVVGNVVKVSIWQVLKPVLVTMFVPLILARLSHLLPQKAQSIIRRGKAFSFTFWLLALLISSAKASDFLRNDISASAAAVIPIALISLALCVVNFSLGALLGGKRFRQESSQSLGQKNNAFVIWVALTFINPLVAMGPTFYILYHNLYNSWQIYRFERRRGQSLNGGKEPHKEVSTDV